jgi:hypothetical protein
VLVLACLLGMPDPVQHKQMDNDMQREMISHMQMEMV